MRTLDLGRAQPKQTLFLKDKHRHIAYGGARGGGADNRSRFDGIARGA